jgi:membrane-associated phospholipid phosphatase
VVAGKDGRCYRCCGSVLSGCFDTLKKRVGPARGLIAPKESYHPRKNESNLRYRPKNGTPGFYLKSSGLTALPAILIYFCLMHFSAVTFWEKLITWDRRVFETINTDWANPFFDVVMPFLRNSLHWAPLYLFVLVFVLTNFKFRGIWWIVFFLVTVALTDMTGTYLFKHQFMRDRPCRDPEFFEHVRLVLNECGGGYSFVSNHAANHFGMAIFFFVTFRQRLRVWAWFAIAWAALIAFAQVYIGVHFPLDVIAGALLGVIIGFTTGTFFNKRFGFAIFDHQPVA